MWFVGMSLLAFLSVSETSTSLPAMAKLIVGCLREVSSYQSLLIVSTHRAQDRRREMTKVRMESLYRPYQDAAATPEDLASLVLPRLTSWSVLLVDSTGSPERPNLRIQIDVDIIAALNPTEVDENSLRNSSPPNPRPKPPWPAAAFLVLVENVTDLRAQLDSLQTSVYWNPRASFVTGIFGDALDEDNASVAINEFWGRRAPEVAVLLLRSGAAYTWFPFRQPHCSGPPMLVPLQPGKFVPQKMLVDMEGCPLTVATVVWPPYVMESVASQPWAGIESGGHDHLTEGLEVAILRLAAERTNFRLRYRVHNTFAYLTSILDVIFNESDVVLGGVTYSHIAFDVGFVATLPHQREVSAWFVRSEDAAPFWISLVRAFDGLLWLLLSLSTAMAAGCMYLLASDAEPGPLRRLPGCLFLAITMAFTSPTCAPRRSWPLKMVFLAYAAQCVVTGVSYQAALVSALANPRYDRHVDTVEEMLQLNWRFFVHPVWFDYLRSLGDSFYDEVVRRATWCLPVTRCLDQMVVEGHMAVGATASYVDYYTPLRYTSGGHIQVRRLDDSGIWNTRMVVMAMEGNPVMDRLNSLIGRMVQAGFVNKWWTDLTAIGTKAHHHSKDFKLTVSKLEASLIILLIGTLFSTLTFVSELILKLNFTRKISKKLFRKFK